MPRTCRSGKVVGQTEAHALVTQLAATNADVYADKLEEMGDASGALQEAFEAQTEGIGEQAFKIEQAKRRFNVFLQTVGAAIAPFVEVGSQFLEPASKWLLDMSTAFDKLDPKWQRFALGATALVAALPPLAIGLRRSD